MDGLNMLGADDVGFDLGPLLQTAGGVAQYGVSAYEQEKKESALKATDKKNLDAMLAADVAASDALAKADVSAQLKSASASIDATAAQMAVAAQDRAGAAPLSAEAATKRADAAEKALSNTVKNAQAKPKDGYAQALVKAWTATANKAHNTAIASGASESGLKGRGDGESFWTRRALGPLPGYAVVVGGVGLLGALGLIVKKVFFK